jgi:hypothetical protein
VSTRDDHAYRADVSSDEEASDEEDYGVVGRLEDWRYAEETPFHVVVKHLLHDRWTPCSGA